MNKKVNNIKNDSIRFILNRIIKKGVECLNNYQIVKLCLFLLSDDVNKLKTIDILKELKIDLKKLYNDYLHIVSMNKINKSIDDDIKRLNKVLNNDKFYYIGSNIDRMTLKSLELIDTYNYDGVNVYYDLDKYLTPILKDLEFYLSLYLSLNSNKTDCFKSDLHKYIKQYDVYKLLDKIYTNDLNKKISIDFNNSVYNNLNDFISNTNNVNAFKIDLDFLNTNKFKINRLDFIKIKITYYDTDKIYYVCNKLDLIDLDLKYSYDFNNLLSYCLDNLNSYYTVFNDNKIKSNTFKFKNFKGMNKVIEKRIKKDGLIKNSKYSYLDNNFNVFNDLLDLDLELKYIDLDLESHYKQLDLDLISNNSDLEYNTLLYKEYLNLIDLLNDLELERLTYSKIESELLNDLIDLKVYYDYLDYDMTYLYRPDLLIIDFMNDFNTNSFILKELKESPLKSINHDINLLNKVVDIIDNLFKKTESYDLYMNDKNYYDYNDTLKHHNTVFNTPISDFKKVSYNNNKFYITE